MFRILILLSVAAMASILFKIDAFKSRPDKTSQLDEEEIKVTPKKIKREPSSIKVKRTDQTVNSYRPELSQSNRRQSDSTPTPENLPGEVTDEESFVAGAGGESFSSETPAYVPGRRSRGVSSSGGRGSVSSIGKGSATTTSSGTKSLGPFPGSGLIEPPAVSSPGPQSSPDNSDTGNRTPTSTPAPTPVLNCSANVGGGAFSAPLSVSLTCTAAADIKYCVSTDGTCCDPESSGLSYSSNIVIGGDDGSYCLSFIGETTSGVTSTVVQQTYTFNNDRPHLEASQPVIFYQTTELPGQGHIASDDFGKINFGVGMLNLMKNDPGPSGMNLDCDEIVTNYVTYPAPTPIEILSFFNTSGVPNTSQLDVPIILNHLGYGENFLTTYIRDNNNAAPVYSCSTTKVTLEDFPYFQADISHGEDGSNSVREFEAGFVAYGFFEEEANIYRGPAGSSSEEASGQKLESGLFQIFY